MFPSKSPLLFMLMVALVTFAVIVTLCVTKNPLAILGLFFLPQVPVVQQPPSMADLLGEEDDDGTPMGFTADVK